MISRFHYITQDIRHFSHARLAEMACIGGADWVQLRVKGKSLSEWLQIAAEAKKVCEKYSAKLIINDSVEIAQEVMADGVHLGKEDMSPGEARKILGNNFIIGGTANSLEEVKRLMEYKVDYIGLGPYRFTKTKTQLNPVLELEGIKKVIQQVLPFGKDLPAGQAGLGWACPLIAIGGIRIDDIKPLMRAGIYGIAVSSAVNLSDDPCKTVKYFLTELKNHSKQKLTIV